MQLTSAEGLSIDPTWSPDGVWVAYASDRGGAMDLWKQPASGGEPVQITRSPEAETQPAWSPDGRTLAFAMQGQNGGVFLIPADGGQPIRVADSGARPAWAPDGRQIAFDSNGSIFLVNVTGGEPELIVAGTSGAPYAAWSPNGDKLYYWDRTRRDLFLVDVENKQPRALNLIPTGEEAAGITVGPQGDRLVFSKAPLAATRTCGA
ncbi:MAG: hypothetical protein R2724_03290 [Bryobacterales bacterium]